MPLPTGMIGRSLLGPAGGLAPVGAVAAPSGGAAPVATGTGGVPFVMQIQLQDNWCWAAVASSMSQHFSAGSTWTQCLVANHTLPRPGGVDCCVKGSHRDCDREWFLDRALTTTGNLLDVRSGPVGFDDLATLLDGNRPLGARIGWVGGSGHFVVFHEWEKTTSGQQFVTAADPFYGTRTMLYHDCLYSYPGTPPVTGTWTHSYWTRP